MYGFVWYLISWKGHYISISLLGDKSFEKMILGDWSSMEIKFIIEDEGSGEFLEFHRFWPIQIWFAPIIHEMVDSITLIFKCHCPAFNHVQGLLNVY